MVLNGLNNWIVPRFGSKRGLLNVLWHRLKYLAGAYREYRKIDFSQVDRLVFVCKGNICRSAYAEAVARSIGLDSVSCGLETRTGCSANMDAIANAKVKGLDLSNHETTPIASMQLREGDLLIAMEPWQAELIKQSDGICYQLTLLGIWALPVTPAIQDPYGASDDYFINCFAFIEHCIHEITKRVDAKKAD